MSTLYIAECARLYDTRSDKHLPIADMPPIDGQPVTFTGTAGVSTELNAATEYVILEADAACHLKFALTSTNAVTTDVVRLAANTPKEFRIGPANVKFISAIAQA